MPLAALFPPSAAAAFAGPLLDDQVLGDPAARAIVEAMAAAIDPLFSPVAPPRADAIIRSLLAAFAGDGAAVVSAVKERATAWLADGTDAGAVAATRGAFVALRNWALAMTAAWRAELAATSPETEAVAARVARMFAAGDDAALTSYLEATALSTDRARQIAVAAALLEATHTAARQLNALGQAVLRQTTAQAIADYLAWVRPVDVAAAEAIAAAFAEAQGRIPGFVLTLDPPPPSPLLAA
jgi:hypothetical protein